MGDIFQSSVSGLIAFQKALSTTSHNIANVNTDGYSRQRVELGTRAATASGSGFTGNGVESKTVRRVFDQARQTAVEQNTAEFNRLQTFADYAGRIDDLLGDQSAGVSPALQDFFGAIQDVANDPTSSSARQTLITQGQNLVSRFQFVDGRLRALGDDVDQQLKVSVDEINNYAANIASLNEQIVAERGRTGGQPPNDLLDQRDALITRLSEKIGTQVVEQNNGAVNVSIGNGQALVAGFTANKLHVLQGENDPQQLGIGIGADGTSPRDITSNLKGGQLGGLLDFRDEVLSPARDELGRLATTISVAFNQQHHLGLQFEDDPNGKPGGDFFSVGAPRVTSEKGSSTLPGVSIDTASIGDLTGSNYRVSFDSTAASWSVIRLSDGKLVDSIAPGDKTTVDGVTIDMGGVPTSPASAVDTFLVQPTRNAVADMSVEISRPGQVAAASPVIAQEAHDATSGQALNTGTGEISALGVDNAFDPSTALGGLPLTLTYQDDPNPANRGFDVNGDATVDIAYDPASQSGGITVDTSDYASLPDGMTFALSGTPDAGDRFTISRNTNARGDNHNALALGQLAEKSILDKGTSTFQESYGGFVGQVGTQTLRANVNRDAQESLLNQAKAAREDVSGVNLDEEAANLLKFQRAYQASAHAISIANTLFDSLLSATR